MAPKTKNILIVAGIVAVELVVLVFVGMEKEGFHIDEVYSFIFCNSHDAAFISHAGWMWGQYVDGTSFDDFVTVQPGEQFAFDTVYYNTSVDCHPPVFYWLLHAVCSLFPGSFSKWFGLGLNYVCFAVTAVLVWLASCEVIASEKLQLLPLVCYGLSPLAVETAIYIRMYMLLTLWATAYALVIIRSLKYGANWPRTVAIGLIVFLGCMTQYYMAVACFWGTLVCVIYLFAKGRIGDALKIGLASLIGVIAMVVAFPYAIEQATGSSTNNVGNEVARELLNVGLWAKMMTSLVKTTILHITVNKWLTAVLLAALFGVGCVLVDRCRCAQRGERVDRAPGVGRGGVGFPRWWLALVFVLTFASVCFIGGHYVYLRYVYHIIPLAYLFVFSLFDMLAADSRRMQQAIACLCVVVATGSAVWGIAARSYDYLILSALSQTEALADYVHNDVIVVTTGRSAVVPTSNLMLLDDFDNVYMDERSAIEKAGVVDALMDEGTTFVAYVDTDQYWTHGFNADEVLSSWCNGKSYRYEKITDSSFGAYYYLLPEVGGGDSADATAGAGSDADVGADTAEGA